MHREDSTAASSLLSYNKLISVLLTKEPPSDWLGIILYAPLTQSQEHQLWEREAVEKSLGGILPSSHLYRVLRDDSDASFLHATQFRQHTAYNKKEWVYTHIITHAGTMDEEAASCQWARLTYTLVHCVFYPSSARNVHATRSVNGVKGARGTLLTNNHSELLHKATESLHHFYHNVLSLLF